MSDASTSKSKLVPLRPTEILRAEHRQIDAQLNVLSTALRRLGDRGADPEVLDRIEEVARYIDHEMARHHRKEEDCLFPFLTDHLVSEDLRLDARIADHEDLNIMSGKFKEALSDCRNAQAGRRATFAAQMLKGYGLYIVHLVREHLLKEDQILFLVADEYLTTDQEATILERFADIDRAGD
ncbi:MAG: hemerythrin domain-containing protein [Acidobacteriota bacterium]|jgi:hemerythrin-like domain-containing protein